MIPIPPRRKPTPPAIPPRKFLIQVKPNSGAMAPGISRQDDLFGGEFEKKHQSEYTSKIVAPTYTPRGKKPDVFQLLDKSVAIRLIKEIESSGLPDREKDFLIEAAKRHNVFNYESIADYYAHSPAEMQRLMEKSALVIIDFNDAVRNGYVKFSEEIARIYVAEHGETK